MLIWAKVKSYAVDSRLSLYSCFFVASTARSLQRPSFQGDLSEEESRFARGQSLWVNIGRKYLLHSRKAVCPPCFPSQVYSWCVLSFRRHLILPLCSERSCHGLCSSSEVHLHWQICATLKWGFGALEEVLGTGTWWEKCACGFCVVCEIIITWGHCWAKFWSP